MTQNNPKYSQKNGFSMIELAFLISIMAMAAIGYFSTITNININNAAKLKITKERIATIENAIISFKNENGRIPCPADSSLSALSAPIEDIANTAGSIPTKTLSLPPEYGLDGWGMKINYYADGNMCSSPLTFINNDGSLAPDAVNMPDISNAAYALVSYGGNIKASITVNAGGSTSTNNSLNPIASILGQGYFVYHKTKAQLNDSAIDAGLNLLTQQQCIDNSLALASINNSIASTISDYITDTERIDTNISSQCRTLPGFYHCGDEAVLGMMWAVQDACALMYPQIFTTKLCPGGGIYNSTYDYCTCASNWSGSGC